MKTPAKDVIFLHSGQLICIDDLTYIKIDDFHVPLDGSEVKVYYYHTCGLKSVYYNSTLSQFREIIQPKRNLLTKDCPDHCQCKSCEHPNLCDIPDPCKLCINGRIPTTHCIRSL